MNQETKKLQIANDQELRRLSYENRGWVRKITSYLTGKQVDDAEVESVRRDVIVMLAGAEVRGEPAESVIGADYKAFCEEVRESVRMKTESEKTKDDALKMFCALPFCGIVYSVAYTLQQLFWRRAWSYEGLLGAAAWILLYFAGLGIASIFVRRRVDYIPWIWKEKKWRNAFLALFAMAAVLQVVWYLRTMGGA